MNPSPFEPGAALARVSATRTGFVIDCRGPNGCRHFDVRSAAEAAELAVVLRDQGGWSIRFNAGTADVRMLVEELSDGGLDAS